MKNSLIFLMLLIFSGCSYYVKSNIVYQVDESSIFAYMKNNGRILDYMSMSGTTDLSKKTDVLRFTPSIVKPVFEKRTPSTFHLSKQGVACDYSIGLGGLEGRREDDFCTSSYTTIRVSSIFFNILWTPMSFFALSPSIVVDKVIDRNLIDKVVKKNDLPNKVIEIIKLKKEYDEKYKVRDEKIANIVKDSEKQLKIIKKPQDMGVLNKYISYNEDAIIPDRLDQYSSCLKKAIKDKNPVNYKFFDFKFYNNSFEKDIDKVRKSIKEEKLSKLSIPDKIDCNFTNSFSTKIPDKDNESEKWSLDYKINSKTSINYSKKDKFPIPVISLDISDILLYINEMDLFNIAFRFEDNNLKIFPDSTYTLKKVDTQNEEISKLENEEYRYRIKISNKINDEILIQSITLYAGDEKVSEPPFSIASKDIVNENIKILSSNINNWLSHRNAISYPIRNKKEFETKKIKIGIIIKYTIGNSLKIHTLKNDKEYKLVDLIRQNPLKI